MGGELRKQPERYVQWGLNLLKKYKKGKLKGKKAKIVKLSIDKLKNSV